MNKQILAMVRVQASAPPHPAWARHPSVFPPLES